MFYQILRNKFLHLAQKERLLDKKITIKTRILRTDEAIGNPERQDFPLLGGKEVLMEATFMDKKGQAYTDAPSNFSGYLHEIIHLQLQDSRSRALFIATLNAVLRYLNPDLTTIHCKNNEPEECAWKIADFVKKFHPTCVGLIGLQPAILEALVKALGPNSVLCIDRNEKNRDKIKYGIPIEWGNNIGMKKIFKKSNIILATGSTIVNGSLVDILENAHKFNRQVYFYGTTIAGAAKIMELDRLCFKSI